MSRDRPVNFVCPGCGGGRLKIYKSQQAGTHLRIRFRMCLDCGCRTRGREHLERVISGGVHGCTPGPSDPPETAREPGCPG